VRDHDIEGDEGTWSPDLFLCQKQLKWGKTYEHAVRAMLRATASNLTRRSRVFGAKTYLIIQFYLIWGDRRGGGGAIEMSSGSKKRAVSGSRLGDIHWGET
jgi:hypothetical protein